MIVIMGFIAWSLLLLPEQLKTGGLPITSRPFCSPWKTARSTDDYTSLTLQCQLNPKMQLANQVTSDAISGNRSVIQRVMSMRRCTDPESLAADWMLPVHKMSSLKLSGLYLPMALGKIQFSE
ncbi:hypothetical protein DV515_00002225, partial [Chloebia gouldiae]